MSAKRAIARLTILCAAALSISPLQAGAQQATAWLYALQVPPWAFQVPSGTTFPLSMGIASRVTSRGAAVFGHLPEPGAVGELATTQAVISVGDEVPLPSYADGTRSQDGEVFWIVQLWKADFPTDEYKFRHSIYAGGDQAVATFSGRQFVSADAHIDGAMLVPPINNFQLLVNVFAFRLHDNRRIKPTSVVSPPSVVAPQPESFGSIKARYR